MFSISSAFQYCFFYIVVEIFKNKKKTETFFRFNLSSISENDLTSALRIFGRAINCKLLRFNSNQNGFIEQ